MLSIRKIRQNVSCPAQFSMRIHHVHHLYTFVYNRAYVGNVPPQSVGVGQVFVGLLMSSVKRLTSMRSVSFVLHRVKKSKSVKKKQYPLTLLPIWRYTHFPTSLLHPAPFS